MKLFGYAFFLFLTSCQSGPGSSEVSAQVKTTEINISVPARFEPFYDGNRESLSWEVTDKTLRVSMGIGRQRVQPVRLVFNTQGAVFKERLRAARVVITRDKSTFGYAGDVSFSQCKKKPSYSNKILASSSEPWENGQTSKSFDVSVGTFKNSRVNSVCFEYQIELMAMDRPVEAKIIKAELIIQK